jgi:hypothetical protein
MNDPFTIHAIIFSKLRIVLALKMIAIEDILYLNLENRRIMTVMSLCYLDKYF